MTRTEDDLVEAWMGVGPTSGPPTGLEGALVRAHRTAQRPGWLASVAGNTIADPQSSGVLRMATILATTTLILGLALGAMVVGGFLPLPHPSPLVIASQNPVPTGRPSDSDPVGPVPDPSATANADQGLVAYEVSEGLQPGQANCEEGLPDHWCQVTRIWISNGDGMAARALHPEAVEGESIISWTADGSRLFYTDSIGLAMAEPDGTVVGRWPFDEVCPFGRCSGLGMSLSPDATRVAYVIELDESTNDTMLGVLDLVTGETTELLATRTTNAQRTQCHATSECEGLVEGPRWSPDGQRIVFVRQAMSPERDDQWTAAAIFIVDADGSNLQRVTPVGLNAVSAQWSADGSRLAFVGFEQLLREDGTGVDSEVVDVYTIRPDGTGVARLTNDGLSSTPAWTIDGRVTFAREVGSVDTDAGDTLVVRETWIVDADGRNPRRLDGSLAELSAAGCTYCLYPFSDETGAAFGYWQPRP